MVVLLPAWLPITFDVALGKHTREPVVTLCTSGIIRRYPEIRVATGPIPFLNSEAASNVDGAALAVGSGFTGALATGQIDTSVLFAGAEA